MKSLAGWACLLTGVLSMWSPKSCPEPEARSTRRASPAEVTNTIRAIRSLNSPCKYALKVSHVAIASPLPELFTPFQRAVEGHVAAKNTSSLGTLQQAFDALASSSFTGQNSPERVDQEYRIVSTPEVQVQHVHPYRSVGNPGILKTRVYDLFLDADNRQLTCRQHDESLLLYDVSALLAPILIDPRSLSWLERYIWEDLGDSELGRDATAKAYKLYKEGEPSNYLILHVRADPTYLPLASSFHVGESQLMYSRYGYGPIAEGSPQLWLRQILQVRTGPDTVNIDRFELSGISFSVIPDDLHLVVDEEARLFDFRTPSAHFWGNDIAAWPEEIRNRVLRKPARDN